MTLGLAVVLVVTGLVLVWAYRPGPDGPTLVRNVHRLSSALLLPASWVLVLGMVRARWGAGRATPLVRWAVPVLVLLAVPAAAFTGFLLPWQEVFAATVLAPSEFRGMGVAFDAGVANLSFGADPISRSVFQRYVIAHYALGTAAAALVVVIARGAARRRRPDTAGSVGNDEGRDRLRGGGRTRRGTGSPRPGRTAGRSPRTRE